MSKSIILLLLIACSFLGNAQSVKTSHIITHNKVTVVTNPAKGENPYRSWGVFPNVGTNVRKIVMYVTLGCPDGMRCADWDYSDRISIRRQGGVRGTDQNYELSRMLTPYGGAFGKNWKFTWQVDVTDFAMLLRDSVEIEYNHSGYEPNNDRGWALTIDFEITKGPTAYKPLSIQKIYDGHFRYGDNNTPIETVLKPMSFRPHPKAKFARLRVIQTGHGMDKPDNCAEFCNKTREIWLDSTLVEKKNMWKKCGDNPLYPQAGTWLIDRANWCPGDLIQPDIYNLTVSKDIKHSLDINMEAYQSSNPSAVEAITAYLIQYGSCKNEDDVAIEDIIVPSSKTIHSRLNPSGATPKIVVKNLGENTVERMTIEYHTVGFDKETYLWQGTLRPNASTTVALPSRIQFRDGNNLFEAKVLLPNGKKDDFDNDNAMSSEFFAAPKLDSTIIFYILTNNQPKDNGYTLKNSAGKTVYERQIGTLAPNTEYRDTLKLKPDAYELTLTDVAGNGLEFWYNGTGGRGIARLLNTKGMLLKAVESDFGSIWQYRFVVDSSKSDPINDEEYSVGLFPTRTNDKTTLDFFSSKPKNITVRLTKDPGGQVVEEHRFTQFKEGLLPFDLRRYPKGRFYFKVLINDKEIFNKRVRYGE